MKRKRINSKGKRRAHNASRNNSSRKDGKKTNKSGDSGRTSPPTQLQSHPEDSAVVSSNQNEPQADQDRLSATVPRSGKAEAQTQTEKLKTKNQTTQTDSVKCISRQTQVETDAVSEAALPSEELSDNVSREKKEEKTAEDSTDVSAPDPGGGQKKDTTTLSDSGGEKELKNEKAGQSGELQTSSDTKSTDGGEKAKSYAEAASACEHTKDSKEQSNQATARQEEGKGTQSKPQERGPPGKPMFTFYVNMVLDKSFNFNRDTDKILLWHANGLIEMEITHFRDMRQDGYLIEANFLVEEHLVQRDSVISYKYAVQHHRNVIYEIVMRALRVPFELSIKEMYLFEPHVTRSGPGFFKRLMRSADNIISKAWHRSAYVLLDRLFEKWDPSNQERIQNFTQLLKHYQRDFHAAGERVVYTNDVPTPSVKVNELIATKLVKILKREMGGSPSESSVDISPVTFGLSVFQVCRGCSVELGIKDWALLCQQVSSDSALRQMGEMQNAFPSLQYTVIGLMNQCARQLLSELVLLVPLLYSVRQLRADSGRLGPTVEELNWTGLQGVECSKFRERIRAYSDKRSMMIKLVQDHKTLAEGNPHILTSWLSMMAFEDIIRFAELTKLEPEHLIQSLMYRMKEFELYPNTDFKRSQNNLEVSQQVLRHLLKSVEQDRDRIMGLELVGSVFQCCRSLHKSTCRTARLTSVFKAPVLSFQLVLKMAEIQNQALSKDEKENESKKEELLTQLETVQKEFSEWRNGLFQKPLFVNSRLGCPNEIELWDALFGLDCSIQCVTDQWACSVERDLRKRISELSDEQKVQVCCVETSAMAIKKSHNTTRMCFQYLCQSAIKNICQAGKERSLLQSLLSSLKSLDSSILSSIILESAARFGNDPVIQLLDAQSAIHVLLSQGHWNLTINEDASRVMNMCQSTLCTLVSSLCRGDIPFGHLQTILKHRKDFQELFKQCKKNCKLDNISIDAEGLLTQRAKDVQALLQQSAHMQVLIKMIGKITEMIHVPDMSLLEDEHKRNLQSVSLNALVETHPCFCNEHLKEISTGQVLYYSADVTVLDTAREMYKFQDSNLILKSWMDRAAELAPVSLHLQEVISKIWQPSVDDFVQLGLRIACGIVTFEEVDSAVVGCDDEGDGTCIKRELNLMATMLGRYSGLEKNWPEERLSQIQEYRQLHHAAASASAILTIRDKLELQGDFSQISSLTQLKEASFKKKTLGSLSNDLISAKQKLLIVNHQHTACLEAFLKSETLVKWVKKSITSELNGRSHVLSYKIQP